MDVPARLAEVPDLLDAVVDGTREPLTRVRSADGGFAVVEHVHHLADFEVDGFAARIARVLAEDRPFLADFDGDATATARRYLEAPCGPSLARFRAARAANIARLALADGDRIGVQAGVGPVTLAELTQRMVDHDRAHLTRLARLLRSLDPALPVLAQLDAFVGGKCAGERRKRT